MSDGMCVWTNLCKVGKQRNTAPRQRTAVTRRFLEPPSSYDDMIALCRPIIAQIHCTGFLSQCPEVAKPTASGIASGGQLSIRGIVARGGGCLKAYSDVAQDNPVDPIHDFIMFSLHALVFDRLVLYIKMLTSCVCAAIL